MTACASPLPAAATATPTASELRHRGERWIGIDDVDRMPPFFTTAVGDNECWLFAGSNGPLCAGRRDPDHALFPYLNVDRVIDHALTGGFRTVIRLGDGRVWEPWSGLPDDAPRRRSLHRHELGNGLLYRERDVASGLVLTAEIATCQRFGLVRRVELANDGRAAIDVDLLDGLHGLLPPGVGSGTWAAFSYLVQAYMRHERVPGRHAALYTLNAAVSDHPEPAEVLRCTAAWWHGATPLRLLLSTRQLAAFRAGAEITDETEVRGATGALLGQLRARLEPGQRLAWTVGADIGLDQAEAGALLDALAPEEADDELDELLAADRSALRARLAGHDALALTGDRRDDDAHRSMVLFNAMRGGVLPADLQVRRDAFVAWLAGRNRTIAARHAAGLAALPETLPLPALAGLVGECGDPQLERLAGAYLPLSFSRRHGDPSRPWNRFSISLFDQAGAPRSAWQGNWRDIFQNWEALAASVPAALPAMIANFVDASTADGYNPYRITSEGLDWEVPDGGPWSHFGYWGDHQICYLTRLLEAAIAHHPGWLEARLPRCAHACADVPYRVRPLDDLLSDPAHGVRFDQAAHDAAMARCAALGSDGRLLPGPDGQPLLLSLGEKLLIPVLAKMSNLVPGAGIWLNTQRPEWNDANNALVGWGCSLVTAFQLHRHLRVLRRLVALVEAVPMTEATRDGLDALAAALGTAAAAASDARLRHAAMLRFGAIGAAHRARVYARDLGAIAPLPAGQATAFLDAALAALDATLTAARREDGLFDAYVVLEVADGAAAVRRLDPMLEGQVAALASGWLDGAGAVTLWDALAASPLRCPRRGTFLLQPDRAITPFLERNRIALAETERIGLVGALLERGGCGILRRDGAWLRFDAGIVNGRVLAERLDGLAARPDLAALVARDRAAIAGLHEQLFAHRTFLGRSTTMFGFEGLGSVYWHMVSKLHLALAEAAACSRGGERDRLEAAVAAVRSGLGAARTPAAFGAFPWDPYSCTPAHAGAQQPGMTGQVKEEILARRVRLGVAVADGSLRFDPCRIGAGLRLAAPGSLAYVDLHGRERQLAVPAGGLAITLCQVPVLFRPATSGCRVTYRDGHIAVVGGSALPRDISQAVFHRSGEIVQIDVGLG